MKIRLFLRLKTLRSIIINTNRKLMTRAPEYIKPIKNDSKQISFIEKKFKNNRTTIE